eukprot:1087740-Prymnesium_polylepis.1
MRAWGTRGCPAAGPAAPSCKAAVSSLLDNSSSPLLTGSNFEKKSLLEELSGELRPFGFAVRLGNRSVVQRTGGVCL